MHFKRLEITGFKSFRDRTIFEFEPGVTAIVGPNGCGKSNISDAIRWVLGEQSAKDLRGSQMEDVIFNGTQQDEPLGLAEVSLTLSNEKRFLPILYDEVTLTRRLFRSGESEYLINHVPVRLRDVVALVMGTGLGQTSYAHMAQGKIDEILSARPEERRLLFEEASGITKYRSQKKEALRKLEQTGANLLRVTDILVELGRQIRSLERQAEKAKRYKEDFEKLKGLELGVARLERSELLAKKEEFSGKGALLKEQQGKLASERECFSQKRNSLREDLGELESRFNTLQGKKMDLLSEIRKGEDRTLLHRERIAELKQKQERLLGEKKQLEEDLRTFKQHVETTQKDYEKSLKEIEERKAILLSLEAAMTATLQWIGTCEKGISDGKLKWVDVAQEHSVVQNDLARVCTELHTLSSRKHRLLLEREKTAAEEIQKRDKREATEGTLRKMREEATRLKEEKTALEKETASLSLSLQKSALEIQNLRGIWSAMTSRCELLEEARKNYEGFSQGAKGLLKEMERKNPAFKKFHGVLADLLEVVPGYERALEELLGSNVQALVVDDEEAARQGIRYLETEGLGRATFMILSSMRKRARGTGTMLEKVKVAPPYQEALSALIGDASVVEDIAEVPFQDSSKTVVTLKGEVYRGGILTGGSPLSGEVGLLGRESKIAALRADLARTEGILNGSLDQQKGLEALQREKESLLVQKREEYHRLEVELSNQESSLETVLEEEKRIKEEMALLEIELEEISEELKELREKESAFSERLHHLEEEERRIQEELATHQALLAQKQGERERTVVQMAEVKTELSAVLNGCDEKKRALFLLENTLQEKLSSIASREEEVLAGVERVRQLTEEIAKIGGELVRLLREKEELDQAVAQAEKEQKETLSEESSFQGKLSLYESELDQIQKELHDLEMREQETQYHIKSLEERLRLTYKLELSSEEEPGEGRVRLEEVRPEIERLREKVERMGPVNLVAIEEYEELKKRSEFLTTQKEDLEKAKGSLHEAIQKINRVTQELFMTTFAQIQAHFQEYFRLLFGGGEARLLLLDEQDVLESGIEILACPPGKKLQSVSLLSGGERAMTVISLLFAVFKEKPSPFCVLDEIDAPLDESNVSRFTAVLREFLSASQFIMVTHNKRTITMADVMYGITMEKTGVSKIVSVRFKEDDLERKEAIPA